MNFPSNFLQPFLVLTLNLMAFLMLTLQQDKPLYVALSGVTLSSHRHKRPFTTNRALSPHDGPFYPREAP